MLSSLSDEQLAARGTREAFEALYERHRNAVHAFLWRQCGSRTVADDLFQTTFLNAFRALASFRGTCFRAWLFAIATRVAIDERRSAARRRSVEPPIHGVVRLSLPSECEEELALLKAALEELPARDKALFLLVRYHDLPIAQAAQAVGLAASSGKVTLFRIQRRLGAILQRVSS